MTNRENAKIISDLINVNINLNEDIKKLTNTYENLLPDYNLKKAEIFLLKEEIKKLKENSFDHKN